MGVKEKVISNQQSAKSQMLIADCCLLFADC